ncbi:CLUMA_CG005113, isoform A [Clunio marinus]|nr:CLUMA_CG005113, isoform A [Clunio marinus]
MEMVEGEILPSKLDKCCFRYDLTLGCAVYVTVEVYLWAIMSIASIYSEFKMIENNDLEAFKTFTINSSYYVTIFGNYSDDISNGII